MKIPFYGIKRFYENHSAEILNILNSVYLKGQIFGEETFTLEKELAEHIGRKHAVTVSSCTDALFFALKAGGVKEGDEVLVSSFSFIASASPIIRIGAIPVFVDIDPDTFLMDTKDMKMKITSKTKAIIGVHLFGQSLDIDTISKIAKQNNLIFIEDTAQGFGSMSGKNKAGSTGDFCCLSFDPTKVISAFGSGGAVLTDDDNSNDTLLKLRYHGKSKADDFEIAGYNSRLSAPQCALISYQIKELLPERLNRLQEIAVLYNNELGAIKELILPRALPQNFHIFNKYVIRTEKRDKFLEYLKKNGISAMVHYSKPLYDYSLFINTAFRSEDINVCGNMCGKVISLPIYPELTNDEIIYISKTIHSFFNQK